MLAAPVVNVDIRHNVSLHGAAMLVLSRVAALVLALGIAFTGSARALEFQPPITIPLGNSTLFSHDLAVADLNEDGRMDIVVVDWVSNIIDVMLGTGGGAFGPISRIPSADAPYSVELVDLNGDHHLDIVSGNRSGASVSVLLGVGDGTFGARTDFTMPAQVSMASVGDMNGDGKLDIVAAADLRVVVSLGDGSGGFGAPTSTLLGSTLAAAQIWALALGDIDNDGDLDVVANYSGPLVLLKNSGTGSFTRQDSPAFLQARGLAIADVDGDGFKDVIAGGDASPGIVILRGNGSGAFNAQPYLPTGVTPSSIEIRDLDLDGRPDIITPNIGSNTLTVLRATGAATYQPREFNTGLNPISAVAADVNGDGLLDIVETGYSGNVYIRMQIATGGTGVSQTLLTTTAGSFPYGASIPLTAQISPSSATGVVRFLRDGVVVTSITVAGGQAHYNDNSAQGGIHSYTAEYLGDGVLLASSSNSLSIEVTPAPTTTILTSSANPAAVGSLVEFQAHVTSDPPASVGGIVIFRLDGTLWQSRPVNPSTGIASAFDFTLPLGHHTIVASFEANANNLASLSTPLDQLIATQAPILVSIRDIRNDQGGKVMLKWDSPADGPSDSIADRYRIWRRASADPAVRAAGLLSGRYQRFAQPGAAEVDYWEALAELPAEGLGHYAYSAATLQDSLPGSNPYTAYFVTMVSRMGAFFHSEVDSGYSVDNLSPPAPGPFRASYTASGTSLHWASVPVTDLKEYRLYRGARIDFVPGPGNLFIATRDTGAVDPASQQFIYKLAAVDLHGNASRFLVVAPDAPVGTLASLESIAMVDGAVQIRWYMTGGAGTAATVYRRQQDMLWTAIAQPSFDGTGTLKYVDRDIEAGQRYGYRLGIMEGDDERFTNEAWIEPATAGLFDFALRSPNPSIDGRWSIGFVLPEERRVALDLLDVTGRVVAHQDLGTLAAGTHASSLSTARGTSAGVYTIRLSLGRETRTKRVVLVR